MQVGRGHAGMLWMMMRMAHMRCAALCCAGQEEHPHGGAPAGSRVDSGVLMVAAWLAATCSLTVPQAHASHVQAAPVARAAGNRARSECGEAGSRE